MDAIRAFKKYIRPFVKKAKWVEDSSLISKDIQLSKRELFTLIILAHALGEDWFVGYDSDDGEPNDGYISNGQTKLNIEHKLVPQMDKKEVLDAILDTYSKYAAKGKGYGENRILVIQPNKAPNHGGLIKISNLKDLVGKDSPFEKVLTVSLNSFRDEAKRIAVMHILEHYPRVGEYSTGKWMTQVNLDLVKGKATVPNRGIIE